MKKRVLSMFMALALCLTLLPAPAWAAETEGGAAQIGNTVYSTLPEAVNAAKDGDTIKLLADYKTAEGAGDEGDDGLTITKSVTLDLNGHGIEYVEVGQTNEDGETVLASGDLTVEDTSKEKDGKVTRMIDLVAGKLTVNGGTIGGSDRYDGVEIKNGTLTVNGGTIVSLYGSADDSGTIAIAGGTVQGALFGSGFNITVTGGSGHTGLWDVADGTWSILGGEFGEVKFKTESPVNNALISGGTFGKITRQNLQNGEVAYAPISELLADGCAFYKQAADSEEYDQCVKLTDAITSLENVQVKGHTHNFVNGVCTVCDYACLHTNMNGDGFCPDCNTQMVAKVEVGDTVTYSADFKEAMKNATNGTKITLLADVSIPNRTGISGDNTTVTLDLNKHKITGGWLDVGGKDTNETYTACTLKIIGKGSYEPPMYGGIITVNMKATLDLSEWEGGTISSINISDSSDYEAETREAAVIVGPKAGTIGKLTFGNNQLDELKKTKLSGGSFNEIWAANHKPVKLGELLADGYAFQNGDGSYVKYETKLQGASISNVKVVKCLHPNMKPGEYGVATCEYCGKSGKFVASVDGNLYTDMNGAISYWLENGGTLKLYTDYTATDGGTWRIGSGSHTVNLNGHRMSVQNDGAFKPTNNMHLTVTDDTERGQITNILLDGSQRGSFTLENGYVCNLEMTDGAVVALKGGSVDNLDVQNCSASTNLSIQGGSIGKLNIKGWADGMHVSATGGSLGAYNLPSGKILADVLDHQYYAEGTSLDRQVDTAQPVEKFVIKQAPYDFGSTSKAAAVPINGSIPFTVDSPSENVGVYEVKWYRRTTSGAEHMTQNRVTGVKVGDTLDVFCVITGVDRPGGAMQWQVAVKGYTLQTLPPSLENAEIRFADGGQERTFWPDPTNHSVGKIEIPSGLDLYTVTLGGKTLTEGTDYRVISGNVATGIGTYDLTIEGIAPHYSGTKTAQWTVVPFSLGTYKISPNKKQYDGTVALPDGVFPGHFDPKSPYLSDITLQEGTDYVVTDARFDTPDASNENKVYRYTVELKNPNYVFANGTKVQTWVYGVDVNATIEITKADAPAAREGALEVINNHVDTYTVDLPALLPALESPKEYGNVTYTLGKDAISFSAEGYYKEGTAKIEGGKLILPIQAVETKETGNIGSVNVKVSTTNYHDFTLTINVNSTNKIVPTGTPTLSKTTLAWGEQLSTITLSGEMKDGTNTVKGKFAWTNSATTPDSMSDFAAEWKFTPENTDVYAEITGKVTIKVIKETPKGAPKYTAINASGKTLADAALAVNEAWPEGTVQWVDENGVELDVSAEVKANTAYRWRFVPTDAEHYNEASGAITLYTVSHSGGGGSSSGSSDNNPIIKTETKNNADGSTTKTETKKDGTVIETTTAKDGSVTRIETKPDGSSVTQRTLADGSTGTLKTDKNGQTEAKTALSNKAIEDAKKNGEPVKTPVEVKATRNSDTAPTVKIELPRNSGEAKVEIPVSNVKPGTVAVIVHPDGTEEIVKNSLPTEDGIQLTVNGGATVKIVDNSKDFIDTRNHWAKDAIDFVSARELVNGMSDSIYAPNNSTTRAQLWTILARQNDADLNGGNTWYEKAQLWSKNKGISDGTEPNAAINRAQMVTMLWRTMGQPTAGGTANFTDVPADSYYAQAVAWAVENGITAGVGGGRFDPNSTCTRAQIATFLRRAMAE